MATAIKTIKNHLTDDTIYPITTANAVFLANSTVDTVEGVLGNTDISSLGDGTITGAIDELNDSKVSKSGDTMTGNLNIDRTDGAISRLYLRSNRATPGSTYSSVMAVGEVNIASLEDASDPIGYFRGNILQNGSNSLENVCRKTINGESIYNTLSLRVSPTGERVVSVSEAAPWLTALGLNNLMVSSTYSRAYTVAANSRVDITASNFGIIYPSGYSPVAMTFINTGSQHVVLVQTAPTSGSNNNVLVMRNVSSSSVSATATIRILFLKTSFYNALN